jgi:ribosomal protein S11
MKKINFVHIKILRGNSFLLISDSLGKLKFSKTCGTLGFKNIEKRTKNAFQNLLFTGVQYLLKLDKNNSAFIKIEGARKTLLQQIKTQFIKMLKSYKIKIFVIKLIYKITHNGCRKSYFRK